MAVKEEKYDPGYEAAYGGAYSENPCGSEPGSFPSSGAGGFLLRERASQSTGPVRVRGGVDLTGRGKFADGNDNAKCHMVTAKSWCLFGGRIACFL